MATVIIQQPDDVPYIGVSEYNPYKKEEDRLSVDEPRPLYFGNQVIHVPATVIVLASELEHFGGIIRVVCTFDIVFALMNFILSGNPVMFIPAFFSYMGYQGALRFHTGYIKFYIFFQSLNVFSKIFWIASQQTSDVDVNTVMGISAIFNMIMIVMSYKFIRMIPI